MVMADEDAKSLLVVVPNDQLSLAIGRQGQNVRLASKLIGWRIDVKSEQRYNNLSDEGYQSLLKLQGVDESLADQLFGKNIFSTAILAQKSVNDLLVIRSISEEFAERLIEEAKKIPFVAKEIPKVDVGEVNELKTESPIVNGAAEEDNTPAETIRKEEGASATNNVENPEE
jgi:N utilization substance protein A